MMSIRMCSLLSNVHGEHSINTTLNSTHCSSRNEFEEASKTLRMMALPAEITTATTISQDSQRPSSVLNASILRLTASNDCNPSSSDFASRLAMLLVHRAF